MILDSQSFVVMKLVHIILSLLLAFQIVLSGTPASKCREFSLGKCSPDNSEVVGNIPMPATNDSVRVCQYLCQQQENCNTFRYNRALEVCDLYHYRYWASCQLVGGTDLPEVDDCFQFWGQDPNNCDGFVDEECSYLSGIILERDTVTDYHSCQAIMQDLNEVLGAKYFVYDSKEYYCQFLDGWERNCNITMGPKYPNLDDCQTITSTPPPITSTGSTAAPVGCENPPSSSTNGEWVCERGSDGYLDVCYLQCSDGYASSDILVHCIGENVWEAGAGEAFCDPLAVMLIGGGINSLTYDSVELYSPSRDCKKVLPNLVNGRSYSVAQSLDDGIVLVCGGTGKEDMLSDCEFLNLNDSSIWSPHSLMNEDRMGADGTAVKNTFFMLGGFDSSGAEHIDTDEGVGGTWKYGPNLPGLTRSIFGHCVVPWGSDGLLIIGGTLDHLTNHTSNEVYLYNTTDDSWNLFPQLTTNRTQHGCARLDDMIIVAGGISQDIYSSDSAEIFTSETGKFQAVSNLNIPRVGGKGSDPLYREKIWITFELLHGSIHKLTNHLLFEIMVVDGGRILMIGGYNPITNEHLDTVEEFSPRAKTWIIIEKRINKPRKDKL